MASPAQYGYGVFLLVGCAFTYGSLYTLFPVIIFEIFGKIKNSTALGCVMMSLFPVNIALHLIFGQVVDAYKRVDTRS